MKQMLKKLPDAQLLSLSEKKALRGGIVRWFTCISTCFIYNGYEACNNDCPDGTCQKGLWACG
jgi:hypothetical protein